MNNTVVKNRNGYTYTIIEVKGAKTLLKNNRNGEFVVGSYMKKGTDGLVEWCWGHYFRNLEGALEYLNK